MTRAGAFAVLTVFCLGPIDIALGAPPAEARPAPGGTGGLPRPAASAAGSKALEPVTRRRPCR